MHKERHTQDTWKYERCMKIGDGCLRSFFYQFETKHEQNRKRERGNFISQIHKQKSSESQFLSSDIALPEKWVDFPSAPPYCFLLNKFVVGFIHRRYSNVPISGTYTGVLNLWNTSGYARFATLHTVYPVFSRSPNFRVWAIFAIPGLGLAVCGDDLGTAVYCDDLALSVRLSHG